MEDKQENKKIFKADFKVSPFSRCRVDIIIPFHGEYERVTRLAKSIMYAVQSNPYRITLVDDGSPNPYLVEELKSVDKVMLRCIRSEEQKGFGAALRLGYENTEQPWVMFIHSDVTIEDAGWMIHMGESMLKLKDSGVKLISARANNPGVGHDPRLKYDLSVGGGDVILSDGFLPFYCTLCHRDLFKYAGGFIKEYPLAGYEDEEFGWRMKYYGFKQAICGKARVGHDAGITIKAVCQKNPKAKEIIESNYHKCVADLKNLPKKIIR